MKNSFDFIAIGDIVSDAFIRLSDAEVKECIDHHRKELSLSFGDKVPYEFVKIVKGVGNSANAAVSAARLGLRSALITDVGGDQIGKEAIGTMAESGVSTDYISIHEDLLSNYHYVLWYASERTILVKHEKYPRKFPDIKDAPKWIYLSSLGEDSLEYHTQIINYLKAHPEVKLAFQPGTFQMKFGVDALKEIYARADIFFCNVEEAQRILKTKDRDIKKLADDIMKLGPKLSRRN
jgi:sugar/nucleoside kinase (ribokinase family)